MSNVTYNPGRAAVTAVPATFTLTVSLETAQILRALYGATLNAPDAFREDLSPLYHLLWDSEFADGLVTYMRAGNYIDLGLLRSAA